jgi:hypothetical protein
MIIKHILGTILLVGGLELEHILFSIIYGIILPIDTYFSRWLKPPTSFFLAA